MTTRPRLAHPSGSKLVRLLAAFLLLAAPALAAPARRVTVLFTSDVHAHLMPFDELRDRPADIGLARVVSRVRAIRKEVGAANVLLLDGGDTIQGSPAGFLHARPPKGLALPPGPDPTIAAMNAAGYDAMAVGNHEFNYGLDVLRRAEREARFPWLSANIRKEDGSPAFGETIVKQVGGVRVGVLGLTTPNIPNWEPEANRPGLKFEDPVAVARRLVPELRAKCDLVVVAFHSGLEIDPSTGVSNGTEAENRVAALAKEVPGIDLLLTGHTHRRIPLTRVSGVPVFQPGRWGEVLVRADVTLAPEGGRLRVSDVKGELLPSDASVPPDPEVARIAAPWQKVVEEWLDAPIAEAKGPMPAARARLGDSALVDLVHDVQLHATGADLSLTALLPGRGYAGIAAGPVRVRDAYALYPYENELVLEEIDGAILKEVLEHSALYYAKAAFADGRLVLTPDPNIAPYDFDSVEGATYRIDPTAAPGARVKDLEVHGRLVRPEDRFTIAVNSYRAQGGGGYAALKRGRVVRRFGSDIRELLIDRLRERKTLDAAADENWYVGPDVDWERRTP